MTAIAPCSLNYFWEMEMYCDVLSGIPSNCIGINSFSIVAILIITKALARFLDVMLSNDNSIILPLQSHRSTKMKPAQSILWMGLWLWKFSCIDLSVVQYIPNDSTFNSIETAHINSMKVQKWKIANSSNHCA